MSKYWRAVLISAAATGAVTAAWLLLERWTEQAVQAGAGLAAIPARRRSREEIVEDLSEEHKQQLLDELNQQL